MSFKSFLPAILFFILTVILLCLPGSTLPKSRWLADIHADKIAHIGMFGLLCVLWSMPLRSGVVSIKQKKQWFGRILCAGIAYGVAMEFVQKYFIPNRSFEIMDIIADSTGCLTGYLVSRWKLLGGGQKNWSR